MPAVRVMTPAHIREPKGADFVEVVFLESARFFKLSRKTRGFDQIVSLLRAAISQRHAVQVRFAAPESDVIQEVAAGGSDG